ncbi:FKBP-type peptidyl-prolyl cis-trans isomerase [Novosphingobium sp.]|uniref:FKBP-type peptidyl-prolyl cis-trans isomerase n=1 Tax=Novosphingobium sp. TaxID=1874826 RepID=UPI00260D3A19|nr:FKBP-type peptidyl-prolyl cis-trans isomerase [Novosphingobium sp.]
MTEITRVPLQPLAKGSLGKLWLGLAAAVAVAGGVAWAAMPPLVSVKALKTGNGPTATADDVALIDYTGRLADGKVFDQGKAPLAVREVVPGFSQALQQMQAGGKYKVVIPAKLAYGDKAVGPIPANSDLYFDIEVLGVMSRQQFEQQRQLMQMLQAQQQGGAAGGAAPQALPQP